MSLETVCLYHKDCSDGLGAAWAVWKRFPDAEFVAVQHGDDLPDVTGKRVIMVDYCPPIVPLTKVCADAIEVTIIDHHKTWERVYPLLADMFIRGDFGDKHYHLTCDKSKSGALLAWEYFHPEKAVPRLIEHISDRDLWQFKLEGTREVLAGLSLHERTIEQFDFVHDNIPVARLADCGKIVLQTEAVMIQRILKQSQRQVCLQLPQPGERAVVPLVNCPKELHSTLLESIYSDHPYAVAYFDTPTHRVFGLRSHPETGIDVEQIAVRYGGGGHKNAAGFQVPRYDALAQL